tara:strand:+ start:5265 stop:9734 length:4470 start_codon:yes stop_codon:yes gene_type:complete
MINKRLFGTDITNRVKKKLEAMQAVSDKTVLPSTSIQLKNVFDKDNKKIESAVTEDYISNNFNGVLDLSSRTPFIRMWTAVEILEEPYVDFSDEEDDKFNYLEIIEGGKYISDLSNADEFAKAQKSQTDLNKRQGKYYLEGKVIWIPDKNNPGKSGKYAIVRDHKKRESYVAASKEIYVVGNHVLNSLDNKTPDAPTKYKQHTYEGKPLQPEDPSVTGPPKWKTIQREELRKKGLTDNSQYFFPPEHGVTGDGNKFMKPAAGIINMETTTEGLLGSVRVTTINFEVHNFADFDAIFNKFFLKPAAQIFIDFGWDTTQLYSPSALLDQTAVSFEDALYGEKDFNTSLPDDGYVTKAKGDMETYVGLVTGYNSKIKENGSVQCTLTISSKNKTLESFRAYEGLHKKVKYLLDYSIYWESMIRIGGGAPTGKNFKEITSWNSNDKSTMWFSRPNANTSVTDRGVYEKQLVNLAMDTFLARDYNPTLTSIESGVHFVGDKKYISWGLLEDRILNEEFGFGRGNNKRVLGTNLNSNLQFTYFTEDWINRQGNSVDYQPSSKVKFLVPHIWDRSFSQKASNFKDNYGEETDQNNVRKIDESFKTEYGGSQYDSMQKYRDAFLDYYNNTWKPKVKKLDDELLEVKRTVDAEEGAEYVKDYYKKRQKLIKELRYWEESSKGPWTVYDKAVKRVPIRDVFVSTKLILDAFSDETLQFKDIVRLMLEEINLASEGVFAWKLMQLPGDDKNLSVVDSNYLNDVTQKTNDYDKLFIFEIMSKNSIVKSYELSLEIPEGDIANMYAIQGLTGVGGQMYPVSALFDEHAAFEDLMKQPIVYQQKPGGSHNTSTLQTSHNTQQLTAYRPGWKKYVSYVPSIGPSRGDALMTDRQRAQIYADYYSDEDDNIFIGGHHEDVGFGGMVDPRGFFTESPVGANTNNAATIIEQYNRQWASSAQLAELNNNQIDANDNKLVLSDFAVAPSIVKYFGEEIKDRHLMEDLSAPLPLKLIITIYGISSLAPGDIFKVDYLPKIYIEKVYFQVIRLQHHVDSTGWYTTLETQFRVRPDKKNQNGTTKPYRGRYLSPKFLYNKVEDNDLWTGHNTKNTGFSGGSDGGITRIHKGHILSQAAVEGPGYLIDKLGAQRTGGPASNITREIADKMAQEDAATLEYQRFPSCVIRKRSFQAVNTKHIDWKLGSNVNDGNFIGSYEPFYNIPDYWIYNSGTTQAGVETLSFNGLHNLSKEIFQYYTWTPGKTRAAFGTIAELVMLHYKTKILRTRRIRNFKDLLSVITKVKPISNLPYEYLYFVAEFEFADNFNQTPETAQDLYSLAVLNLSGMYTNPDKYFDTGNPSLEKSYFQWFQYGFLPSEYSAKQNPDPDNRASYSKAFAGEYEAVMVTNPMYMYTTGGYQGPDGNMALNGYGGIYANGCKQGVYKPGNKAYLIINNQDPKKFWAVVPDIEGRRPGDPLFKKFYDVDVTAGTGKPSEETWYKQTPVPISNVGYQ